ncbi:MAG: FAD-dependent oxidoreductase [Candidatus Omnitrophica bacterium]|nr:FAD-dependent oxidoreductase [Candidatus Omnitrophota bacterium]
MNKGNAIMENYDLVVIGGGVGGLVASSGAARLGASVALVEKEALGGDCLHWGCVPTKRLVRSAKVSSLFKRSEEFGIEKEGYRVNFKKVMDGMHAVQADIGKNDDPERFRKMGIEVIFGSGKFIDPHTFEVNGRKLYGKRILIATGSRPVILPIPGLEESKPLTNITALKLDYLPKSMIILGAGPIGLEFAQIFARLGTKITVIEKVGQVLPREDKEIAGHMESILKAEGIDIVTCMEVKSVKRTETGKRFVAGQCDIHGTLNLEVDEVMIAIGRSPNVEGLDLEAAGVEYDKRKGVKAGLDMRTSQRHIFSCGDVSGPFPFTHVAEYQAGFVVSNALFPFLNRRADYRVVPWTTYTDPELGRVGLTEEEAQNQYGKSNIQVFRFPFKEVDRAVIEAEGNGLIKLVCSKKNQILGAHLLGPSAGELLHEYVLAMKEEIPITKISQTIHVYPTLSQGVKRACDQYYKEKLFSGWLPKVAKKLIRLMR